MKKQTFKFNYSNLVLIVILFISPFLWKGADVSAQCTDLGIYYWGGQLKGVDSANIIPTAHKLADSLGVHTIRLTLCCNDDEVYCSTSHCIGSFSLTALASRSDFHSILADPQFSTIVITAYDWTSYGDCSTANFIDTTFYTPSNTLAIENEYKDLANYLSSNFPSKQFIITQWEADNQVYCGAAYYDPGCPSAKANMAGMRKWLTARYAGIHAASAPNVKSGIEFCNIHSLHAAGKPDVLDTIVPYVQSDYYLYSSYESINISPQQTIKDIHFIRHKLDSLGKDTTALLFGEMGFGANDWGSDSAAASKLQGIITAINQCEIPLAYVWVLIDHPTNFGAYDSLQLITDIGKTVKSNVCITTGNQENNVHAISINVIPNPSEGKFIVQIANSKYQPSTVEIYNLLGEKVYQSSVIGNQSSVIDISGQPVGIYFLQVNTDKESFKQKIIRIK
jgi:Secretion system C-terminal sorting domain